LKNQALPPVYHENMKKWRNVLFSKDNNSLFACPLSSLFGEPDFIQPSNKATLFLGMYTEATSELAAFFSH